MNWDEARGQELKRLNDLMAKGELTVEDGLISLTKAISLLAETVKDQDARIEALESKVASLTKPQ